MMTVTTPPTLDELRRTVQKDRHREIGNVLARRIGRPSAVYGTYFAIRLGLSAHQVTLAALIVNLAAALAIGWGRYEGFMIGVALAHLGFWLDHVDGQVARYRGTSSIEGVYLDYLMHHTAALSLALGLGQGLAAGTGDPRWSIAGFAIGFGWLGLSLHNDCRYKAFFQQLKCEARQGTVQGGGGSRPTPPASWPSTGLGMITWPLYKSQEPHVVLMLLTAIAIFAAVDGRLAFVGLQATVACLAVIAPGLAVARVWRTVRRSSLTAEYSQWFPDWEPLENPRRIIHPGHEPATSSHTQATADYKNVT